MRYLLSAFLLVLPVRADVLLLGAVADTSLLESDPNFNFGKERDFPVGTLGTQAGRPRSRGLIRFDPASELPAGAVIESASVRLVVTRTPEGAANSDFELHRLLRDWGEGQKQGEIPGGAPAAAGDATWNARHFPDETWGIPGGEAGVDYGSAPSATRRFLSNGAYSFSGSALTRDVQDWLDHPESNFGWILVSTDEEVGKTARRVASRENTNSGNVPQLTVEFGLPTLPPPEISAIRVGNGTVEVEFEAEPNAVYELQGSPDVDGGDWAVLAVVHRGPVGGSQVLTAAAGGGRMLFCRLWGMRE